MDNIIYSSVIPSILFALFIFLPTRGWIKRGFEDVGAYLAFFAISVIFFSSLYHTVLTDIEEGYYGENTVENFVYDDDGTKKAFQNFFDVLIHGQDAECIVGNQVDPSDRNLDAELICGDDLSDSIYVDTYEFVVALTVLSMGLIAFFGLRATNTGSNNQMIELLVLVWTIGAFIIYASGFLSHSGYAVFEAFALIPLVPVLLQLFFYNSYPDAVSQKG
tara:strand:+ start:7370 stop:8026 length:657 start_codon:yes stop_codon:yes gene_type:complete